MARQSVMELRVIRGLSFFSRITHFSKLPGIDVGKTIMTDSEAVAAAVAAKSARLKELRLARDATEQAAPAIAVKKAGKKDSKKNGKKKHPAVSLSDWLKNRQAAGHSH
jgi:hypothetical protein